MMKTVMFTILSVLFVSCGTRSVNIAPEYESKISDDINMVIMFDVDNIIIENEKDVQDDIGPGDTKKIFLKFFLTNFRNKLEEISTIKNANYVKKPDTNYIREQELNLNDQEFYINQPVEKLFKSKYDSYDFALILEELVVSRNGGEPHGGYLSGNVNSDFERLDFKIKFLIWDINEETFVSYGYARGSDTIVFGMTKNTWLNTTTNLIKKIFNDTPFYDPFHKEFEVKYEEI